MAKSTKDNSSKVADLLKKALALLTGSSEEKAETPEMPAPAAVKKLKPAALAALAEAFNIDVSEADDDGRSLIETAAKVVAKEADAKADAEELTALCAALGLTVGKKASEKLAALEEYFEASTDTEDSDSDDDDASSDDGDGDSDDDDDDSSDDDADSDSDDDADSDSDDDADSDDDDDEDEKPAKGKDKGKKKAAADDDDDDDSSDDDDDDSSDDDDDDSSDDDDADSDDDDTDSDDDDDASDSDDEEEEVSAKEAKSRLAAYNAVAKKKLGSYDAIVALLKKAGAKWGEAYAGGDDGDEGYCCGFPLKEVKHKGKPAGKCQITGTVFVQNAKGELVAV